MHPTPGPWVVGTFNTSTVYTADMREQIADCAHQFELTGERDRANARLIAAAPDLLTALEAILDVGLSERTHALAFKAVAKARDQGE